jgi:hypothetical protein
MSLIDRERKADPTVATGNRRGYGDYGLSVTSIPE